jgi:hypothetical protein
MFRNDFCQANGHREPIPDPIRDGRLDEVHEEADCTDCHEEGWGAPSDCAGCHDDERRFDRKIGSTG